MTTPQGRLAAAVATRLIQYLFLLFGPTRRSIVHDISERATVLYLFFAGVVVATLLLIGHPSRLTADMGCHSFQNIPTS